MLVLVAAAALRSSSGMQLLVKAGPDGSTPGGKQGQASTPTHPVSAVHTRCWWCCGPPRPPIPPSIPPPPSHRCPPADCPFAHSVLFAAAHKGIAIEVVGHSPTNKPAWLCEEQYGGRLPTLVTDLKTVADPVVQDSRSIVAFLDEKACPEPSLTKLVHTDAQRDAEAAAAPLFGAFARYCTTVEIEADVDRKAELLRALCALDAHLAKVARPFAAGGALSTADIFLAPQLYHIKVAGAAFKDFEIPPQFEALQRYIDELFELPALFESAPKPAMVRWGWACARGEFGRALDEARSALGLPSPEVVRSRDPGATNNGYATPLTDRETEGEYV